VQDALRRRARLRVVAVVPLAVAGGPAPVLLDAAKGADLLVLGHRGQGAFSSAVLGSVGLQCVLHATCPVTIVRPSVVGEG
jgi:nucleotide-binding universal stress UspA family protein